MAKRRIFTIYDKLDEDGYFDSNPANPQSRGPQGQMIYTGPVKFPKMVYDGHGFFKITNRAEAVATPMGPKFVGEQRELINMIVENEGQYAEAKKSGWLDTPAEAMTKNPNRLTQAEALAAQSGSGAVPTTPAEIALAETKRQLAEANAKIAELEA